MVSKEDKMRFLRQKSVAGCKKYPKVLSKAILLLLITQEAYGYSEQWPKLYPKVKEIVVHQLSKEKHGPIIGPVPTCKGATFCENVPYYPKKQVKKTIVDYPILANYGHGEAIDTQARNSENLDEEPLCVSIEQIVYPKTAKSRTKEWLYILNDENFLQSVRIETCLNENSSCRIIDGFAEGYTTSCKQKYIYRKLSAIAINGTVVHDYFRFPASCCCHVEFTGVFPRA